MGTKYVHPLLYNIFPDVEKHQSLAHVYGIDLVTLLESLSVRDDLIKVSVTMLFSHLYKKICALTLSLSLVQEVYIVPAETVDIPYVFTVVCSPYVFVYHHSPPVCEVY